MRSQNQIVGPADRNAASLDCPKAERLGTIDDFLVFLASERGASPHTIEAYQRDILKFFDCYDMALQEVTREHLVAHMSALHNQGYAPASISRAAIALKVFLQFCKREGYTKQNVATHLDTPKLWQRLPSVLSQEEMERLLEVPDTTTASGARDRAILEVLYATGIRVSELCQLNILSIDDTFVRVMGKGSKERLVPIGSKAIEAVDHYLGQFRHDDQEALFLNRRGKRITRLEVGAMVKKYAERAGITKNVHPHLFRHTFATHLLDHGADLRVIQEMLGHATITSTDRYTHVSRSHLTQAFSKFHPRYE